MNWSTDPVVKPTVNGESEHAGGSPSRPALLHVYPSFAPAGVPLRMARIINHLGARFQHTILALDNRYGAATEFAPDVDVTLLPVRRQIRGAIGAALAAARILQRTKPHLLITCNWGSIEWAIANRLLSIAPHIHLEAGFGKEEADAQIRRRVLCRRWALARCAAVIVPSRRLEELARNVWKLRAGLVTYVPNGVDLSRFAAPARDAIPGFERRRGELVIGTVAPLRPEKNIGRLLRAFARLDDRPPSRLIIAGDGTERCALEQLANDLGIRDRVVFAGQVRPESVLGSFDIFALSSDTEQMPNALLEAMAAGHAVAAVDVGDVKAIVCKENTHLIVPRDDLAGFASAIRQLLENDATRARLGRMNRERAAAEFSQERMFAAYSRILSLPI